MIPLLSPGPGAGRTLESSLNKSGYHNTAIISMQLTQQVK